MDAREKWNETAKKIATEYAMRFGGYVKYPSGTGFDLCEEKLNELDAHLRTTPEGFALVPVPEWVKYNEFTGYPAPDSSGWFWYIKDDEIFRGTAMQVCLARGVTYWCPADNPPAPPKSEPL